jgi:hypothetical protein
MSSLRDLTMMDDDDDDDLGAAMKRAVMQSSRNASASSLQPSLYGAGFSSTDEISLEYSTDAESRAYPPLSHSLPDDDVSEVDGPDAYFTQGYPTMTLPNPPPFQEPEPEEPAPWYAVGFEYIFGGNESDDDDVSTIYGGFDEPSQSFGNDPTADNKSYRRSGARTSGAPATIMEGEDESASTPSHRSSTSRVTDMHTDRAGLSYHETSMRSLTYSGVSKSVSDLGAAKIRGNASYASSDSRRWSRGDNVMKGDGIMKASRGNASWRSSRSAPMDRQSDFGSQGTARSARTIGTTRSARTMGSVLPPNPQLVKFGEGGPMMTTGMSGRAVVHVDMKHSADGSIKSVNYTTPLVSAMGYGDDGSAHLADDDTIVMGNKETDPWYDYYFYRNNLLRLCHSRRCYRINALVILCSAMLIAVGCSIVALFNANESTVPVTPTVRSSDGQRAVSLSGLKEPQPAATVVILPTKIENQIDDWLHEDGNYFLHKDDVPFYFHIPMSGALVAAAAWGSCLGFTLASDVGRVALSNDTLKPIQIYGNSYVNVDTTTEAGIAHAKKMQLVPSSLPDVIFSPLFTEAVEQLYSPQRTAKLIVTFRHPVERAVAMYHYRAKATWDPGYDPKLSSMTLEEYVLGNNIENNYVTRLLLDKHGGSLTPEDLAVAKEILRRKAVVGLYDNVEESIQHINRYFSWTPVSADTIQCQTQVIHSEMAEEAVVRLDSGSTAYALISQHNRFDLNLFEYVKTVLVPYQHEVIARQTEASSS